MRQGLIGSYAIYGLASLLAAGIVAACLTACGGGSSSPGPAARPSARNVQLRGHDDLQGRPASQIIVVNQSAGEIAYVGHLGGAGPNPLTGQIEINGTSIIDVTNPDQPKYLAHIPGASGALDVGGAPSVQVCSGDALPASSTAEKDRKRGHWYLLRTNGAHPGQSNPTASDEIYDVTDPRHPQLLTTIVSGLSNAGPNWWECSSGFAYLVAGAPSDGWQESGAQQHLKIYNLRDPSNQVFVRDFGLVGQQPGASGFEGPVNPPPGIAGLTSAFLPNDRMYFGYGSGSDGVLQIVDRTALLTGNPNDVAAPQISLSTIDPANPGDQGAHTLVPIPFGNRSLLLVTSAESDNQCTDATGKPVPDHIAYIYDITDETHPAQLSILSVPRNPGDFCNKGGRFGADTASLPFYYPYNGRLALVSWFNAGLQIFDIRNPRQPARIGYFIPAPNGNTQPSCLVVNSQTTDCKKAVQTTDVTTDDRGFIYIADRAGTGMDILRLAGSAAAAAGNIFTVNVGSNCLEDRFGSQSNCNANDQSVCEAAAKADDCGFEDLNPPSGDTYQYTNAYCQDSGPLANPWEAYCQGQYVPVNPQQPVTFNAGSNCLEDRFGSQANCNANDQQVCQAAATADDCGAEQYEYPQIPAGYQFNYTNAYCDDSGPAANPWEAICQGDIGPQPYPQCQDAFVVEADSASDCPGACTAKCGLRACGYPGGYCTGGTDQACQIPDKGSQIYCDCGTSVTCYCTGPNCG